MSTLGKIYFLIFIVFIFILLITETVTGNINYEDIRNDDQPFGVQPEHARTTREILEMLNNWATSKPRYTLQETTEHLLQFGALLRIHILDTFGNLVYDHYDDYSIGQTEALYKVYQETLERKYNIFDIVPSVLANSDIRPTKICRHIHKHVHTCLKESSMLCTTIQKHDHSHLHTSLIPVVNITRKMYKSAGVRKHFPRGFSLPAILRHLKIGTLRLTVNLVSGLLHNVQYDSFDDEVRTAERNVMVLLMSEMLDEHERKNHTIYENFPIHAHTVSELLKELFDHRKTMYDGEEKKNFDILSEHVIREVEAISRNIELLGTVYENNTIDMKYLLNLVLPQDVVDEDITEAKDYLLQKINDHDIVRKYLKVEKYQQSGPDQLLMEILGQMRDINFAVDIVTALHVHARFWHQSHMINNLNELLELFDAYENLRNVPEHSELMLLMNKIRKTLWDSKNVTIEMSCNNPRACLRLGLETIAKCVLINSETKDEIVELLHHIRKSGGIYSIDETCPHPMNRTEVTENPQTSQNPTTITEEFITDLSTRRELVTTELSTIETTNAKSDETFVPSTSRAETTTVLSREQTTHGIETPEPITSTTEAPVELFEIITDDITTEKATTMTSKLRMESTTEVTTEQTTDSIVKERTTTPVTTEEMIILRTTTELSSETQTTEGQLLRTEAITEESTTTTLEPIVDEVRTQETTTTEQTTTTEKITTEPDATARTTIIPRENIDCSGNTCTTESSDESTETLPSDARAVELSSPPPLSSDDMMKIELKDLSTTTAIPTTTEVSMIRTTATTENIPTSTTPLEQTTPIGKNPGLSKKPKTYSASSSGEDCSGESCSSEECSDEGCWEDSSPEETTITSECSGINCTNTKQFDCEEDGNCSSSSSSETCDGPDCESETSEPECSGEDCPSTPGLSFENRSCEGGECSTTSPECVDDDCLELPKSTDSTCIGNECFDHHDERQALTTTTRNTDPPIATTGATFVQCDNKDFHHRKKLDKLKKIRIINAIYATATIPTASTVNAITEDDSLSESHSAESIPVKKHKKLSHSDLPPWLKFPQDKVSKHPSSWESIPRREIEEKQFDEPLIDAEIISRTYSNNEKLRRTKNANVNLINLRRYLTGNIRNVTTPGPLTLHMASPKRSGYKKVTKISEDPDSKKSNKKLHHKIIGDIKPGVRLDEGSDIPRRRMINSIKMNPVIYEAKRSEDNIDRLRKNRSIIRAPQKISRRYQAL